MVENAGRKLIWIAIALIGSLLAVLIPWSRGATPFPLGLDIAGGTRLVYGFDVEEAKKSGQVSADASPAQILSEAIQVVRERLDNAKQTEALVRASGGSRFEVQVPAMAQSTGAQATTSLGAPLDATAATPIVLGGDQASWTDFPAGGGVVAIGGERIRFKQRVGGQLMRVERGFDNSTQSAHETGANVVLISDDQIKNAIENLGDLHFYANALDEDFRRNGSDQITAKQKLDEWLAKPENANATIAAYNSLSTEQGGPPAKILWFPRRPDTGAEPLPLKDRPFVAVVVQDANWSFEGADLTVRSAQDDNGLPAVGFEFNAKRRVQFTEFTRKYIDRQMAIVLNDEVVTDPVIQAVLPGSGVIEGGGRGFTQKEVNEMVTVLRSGSLKIRPTLEQEEKVGASIGDDYVRRNMFAGALTLLATMLFMIFYYRWLGVWASLSLLANLILLMGAMVLTQSTLTLAGIAGLVLTVGMAVDANILIFDRIREEQDKGRKPIQAAKEGFSNALSAIVDGNVVTLITGLILYAIGTGTIKGFAVTLCLGILTSLFSALVVTRLLIHYQLKRGVEKWESRRWLADANFKFMSKGPMLIGLSSVLIIAGVTCFVMLDNTKTLGIDFLGGASVKIRTENALPVAEVRRQVEGLPSEVRTAEVVDLPSSRDDQGNAREFRLTFKTKPEATQTAGIEKQFAQEVSRGLASILQKGPIELTLAPDGTSAQAQLYFEARHSPDDVKAALAGGPLTDPQVDYVDERREVFKLTAGVAAGSDANTIRSAIENAFAGKADSSGRTYKLVGWEAETMIVGAQVVGELRDSAIKALALSALLILLYIRVRFAEYSYGFAALIADVHDVLMTVAVIALLIALPVQFINVETNLTMIAAFLTILGYSLNDTIVVFDRIRENRPRVKGTLREIVDLSLNQTLSRTIVTGSSTILGTFLILVFNWGTGNVLEGFSFALLFGVIVGTYSSLFIASPIFVWLEERAERKYQAKHASQGKSSSKPAASASAS